ncbi:MAG: hypothetical protein M1308_05345 [Actinobacteria bacterium]|nr:hypothetical protein [Actinomycetota bacterium]
MSVETVVGEIDEKYLGVVSTHEHILLNSGSTYIHSEVKEVSKMNLFKQKVAMSNLGELRFNALAILDNLILSDVNLAIEEILEFKKFGGDTIVDLTNEYMGRDPVALKNISRITGLNIITCTGHYLDSLHPEYVEQKNESELSKMMIKEIKEGIGETGIRAGVIGEIGTSKEILFDEKKVLRASAFAQIETGVAIFIHTWPWSENGLEIIDILKESGVNLKKVVICHIDGKINIDYYKKILDQGSFVEFDMFGKDFGQVYDNEYYIAATDIERINAIWELINIKEDYIKKILVSTDRCLKMELVNYGGYGYAHILKNIIPLMRKKGFSDEHINILISENPGNILNIQK